MKKATQWFVVSALSASGIFAFACGGGDANTNTNTTPSATATETTTASATMSATAAATTPPVATTAAPLPPPPPLVVAAMKMAMPSSKNGTPITLTIELKDDGTVNASQKPVAKIAGAELQDSSGKTLIAVAADGTITMAGSQKGAKFDDKNDLQIDGGAKLSIGDDGVVKLFNPDGKADKDSGKIKFTGFKPTARRAAVVLVLGMMMATPSSATATVTSSSASSGKK